ncbi:MAG: hypothetical protein NW215_12220 [Hyphomicrobiales bacterium]|nr:hypothetical protein [Hyphomicrobiales bacterium]
MRGTTEPPITEVQARFERNAGLWRVVFLLIVAALAAGVVALGVAVYGAYVALSTYGRTFADDRTHFKYGSIGAELANGLPYALLVAMPRAFPEHFGGSAGAPKTDLTHFGFLYEKGPNAADYARLATGDKQPKNHRLPIGFAKGVRQSVEVAWFNCAVCHAGKVTHTNGQEEIILGMPANTVDLERFFLALFDAAVDKRFNWKDLRAAMEAEGFEFGFIERLLWEWVVIPNTRSGLLERRDQLLPLLRPNAQPRTEAKVSCDKRESKPDDAYGGSAARGWGERKEEVALGSEYDPPAKPHFPERATPWGPGRVDTFNPYKLIHFDIKAECLAQEERAGAVDFPTIFLQGPRGDRAMHLHWDGNNSSLKERNLSAAFGAGVTEATVDMVSIRKVAAWLGDLRPPPSPHKLDAAGVARGRAVYMRECAACHGYHDGSEYVFEGAKLGSVEDIAYVGTDRGRMDSYTKRMEKYQKEHFFRFDDSGYLRYVVNYVQRRDKNSPWRFFGRETHQFQNFKKTNGYANAPLDGLWLRAPYLHNGSVPTLADLLEPPERRPPAFIRGGTALDPEKGGFETRACLPDASQQRTDCYATATADGAAVLGNGAGGHVYGVNLPADGKRDLLTYLKSF